VLNICPPFAYVSIQLIVDILELHMFSGLSISDLIIVLISVIISLSIHEAMHGFVAHWLGDTTAQDMGRLTLNPLKHIDLVTTILLPLVLILTIGKPFFAAKPVPFNPNRVKYGEYGAALVGIAGPITNLLLACIAGLIIRVSISTINASLLNDLALFTYVNIGFFVFNMIPFPPLDGSRLLYALSPEPLQRIMQQIESYGFVAILIFVFVLFQFISPTFARIETDLFTMLTGLN
jgi:Zn-dependent protease